MFEAVIIIAAFFFAPRIVRSYKVRKANRLCPPHLTVERKAETLSEALRDANEQRVLTALGILHEDADLARQVIPELLHCVRQQQNLEMMRVACLVLGNCHASSTEVVSALAPLVSHSAEGIRRAAVWALVQSYSELKKVPLLSALNDSIAPIRMLALMGLENFARIKDVSILPAVIAGLNDTDQSVQYYAGKLAEELGVVAKDAIPAMVQLLHRTKSEKSNLARSTVCNALKKMGVLAEPAIPILIDLTKRYGEDMELYSFDVFTAVGPGAAPAIPIIAKALKEGDPPQSKNENPSRTYQHRLRRSSASAALAAIGAPSVPTLLDLLSIDESVTDFAALHSLWNSEELAKHVSRAIAFIGYTAFEPLLAFAKSATGSKRRGAIYALSGFGNSLTNLRKSFDGIGLLRFINDRSNSDRISAVSLFLKSIAEDDSDQDQDAALFALTQIVSDYPTAISELDIHSLEPVLVKKVAKPKSSFSACYAANLLLIRGSAESLSKLSDLRHSSDEHLALIGLKATRKVAPEQLSEAASALLHSKNEPLRCELVHLLADRPDNAAIPVLVQALGDSSDRIVKFATEALQKTNAPQALEALKTFQNKNRVPALIAKLQSSETPKYDRERAATELGELENPAAVPTLFDALSVSEHDLRENAMRSLGKLLEKAPSGGARLIEILHDTKFADVAEWALRQIGKHKLPNAVVPIMNFYSSSQGELRRAAALALGDLGDDAKAAVSVLIAGLLEDDWACGSLQALAGIGDSAVPEIVRSLSDKKRLPFLVAALGEMKTPFSLEALNDHASLIEQSIDEIDDEQLRFLAIGVVRMAKTRPNTVRQAAKRIKYAELGSNGQARNLVATTLLETGDGTDRAEAIAILRSALQDRESYYRDEALKTLSTLLPPAELEEYSVAKLAGDLEHGSYSIFSEIHQFKAAKQLLDYQSEAAEKAVSAFAKKKLPALIASLEASKLKNEMFETDPLEAVSSLGKFGAPAASALTNLLERVTNETTKNQILVALNKIQLENSEQSR